MPIKFQIDDIEAVDWRGEAPTLPGEIVETHNIPGANGVGFQLMGQQGDQFTAELVFHFGDSTNPADLAASALMRVDELHAKRSSGPVEVIWQGLDIYQGLGVKYKVISVKVVESKIRPRILGDGYDYSPAYQLRVQVVMRPVFVGLP